MKLAANWHHVLQEELTKPYIFELKEFLEGEREKYVVYPPEPLVFNAFLHTAYSQVKVVIMGQDPYHGEGQAHGLSFSVPCGVTPPPSLKNIFLEIQRDLQIPPPQNGCLSSWAKQGVLLLNATLTVRAKTPRSHYGKGWERFTDAVINVLAQRKDPLVFVLWGKSAQEKVESLLQDKKMPHAILTAAHPSPYSAHSGFFGCRHFSQINALLKSWGKEPIDWGCCV